MVRFIHVLLIATFQTIQLLCFLTHFHLKAIVLPIQGRLQLESFF